MRRRLFFVVLMIVCVVLGGWTDKVSPPEQDTQPTPMVAPIVPQVIPPEIPVHRLRLTNPTASGDNEFSGMAWYGDTLVMLPQFPPNVLYTIEKATILEVGSSHTYEPGTIPFRLNGELDIPGFQGYEAIAFYENTVYLTIESGSDGQMHSHLISGTVSASGIELDVNTLIEIPQLVNVGNKADESIIMVGNQPMTLYEWNNDPNVQPVAHLFSPEDRTFTEIPLPPIPYRITDATTIDDEGRFWVINFLSPTDGERQDTGLLEQLNYRGSHGEHQYIERLLELQLLEDEIILLDDTPLYLELTNEARNWEGIVRLDDRGFLLITDSYPGTVLGFVPFQRQ
jgi:hypothetical protein